MRVLRISHSAVVDAWRGRERALASRGVDVEVLCAERWVEGGVSVSPHPLPGERVTGVRTWGSHPALFVYDPRPVFRALRAGWDVVDVHEEPFALATAEIRFLRWLSGVRSPFVLYTAQNLDKRYPIPFRWLERSALRAASGVSACNTEAADIAERKGFAGRARVIPLGVDAAEFAPREAADSPDDRAGLTVGFVGRLVAEKGVLVLLDAVAGDERMRVRIAGDGPLAAALPAEIARRGLEGRVELLGALQPDDVPAFYRSLDVLAVPSLPTATWTEQFGRVAVEAMACGIPVVASDSGALPDVVGGAGIVVPRGDAPALRRGLLDAVSRSSELRAAGFVRAAECSWDAVAGDYLALYRSVMHEPAPSVAHASETEPRAVEIIVVAYGAPDLLRAALEPVRTLAVTVVDNSSLPEIADLCAELGVRYFDAGRNGGFAAGVNLGLANRLLPDADVLLLNPDARIAPDAIAALQAALHADPRLASVAPQQTDDGGHAARVEWPFPSPLNSWLEAAGLGRFEAGGTYVIGAVMLLRAEALEQVGGFDERFFLYAEETDWAYRAWRLGWRHGCAAGVAALHEGAGTSSDERVREAHFHASQERYHRKHFGPAGWSLARTAVWLGAMARSVLLPGERGRSARRRAALYRLGPVRVEARLSGR
ncbi:glycosyltransferase [Microbacterium sp. ASV49]|uniref:D-inositol 3-phosphate glycosyltransferase n=1 Tax=Microbacterium candidum TaxID=3041922 RepID=A0ABT7MV06_9MICO|nr:glycosyltransferase [Microbacterium sp. ASV49]MDL9978284.1 glycosyltransferase [Microbacterium sp. ASV49]